VTPGDVVLRDVIQGDLPVFFEHQSDPVANRMAAFEARDREAFMVHWRTRVLGDETAITRTILYRDQVAGNIVCYLQGGRRLVGYWIGRPFWGKGIATAALSQLLAIVAERPLVALVAKHNAGSIRVLEKCGFVRSGEERTPASERSDAIDELVFTLAR
jgi:RimJ/RimL family protein N-acetyltransferase